jgi:nicotinate-nucleotide adenylyltransferase
VDQRRPGRRIGVFGGTFDPPHIAHLVMASDVRHALGLDVVLMVPAGEPWQKVGTVPVSPARDRRDMLATAIAGVEGLEVCELEVRRRGPTYTVDTLQELRAAEPDAELFLVLGADAAAGLGTWHRGDELADLCRIVVVDRPGAPGPVPPGVEVTRVEAPRLDISSTELRRRHLEGRSLRFLVPDGVVSLIEERGLYAEGR